jgi:Fic family protein
MTFKKYGITSRRWNMVSDGYRSSLFRSGSCERLHGRLMKGVRGDRATPGEFRRSQNWIGPSGSTVETAPYVPPPPEYLDDLLGDWERFLHERNTLPDLIQCAIMHEQFEAIHPFLDGNGRLGRLLITLFLIERGRLPQPLLYLSSYIEAHRQDYYELLQRVRTHGDWMSWLRFFIAGVTEIALEAVGLAGRLMDLREKFRARLRDKAKALALLDELFSEPLHVRLTGGACPQGLQPHRKTGRDASTKKRNVRRNYRAHMGKTVPGKTHYGNDRDEGERQISALMG